MKYKHFKREALGKYCRECINQRYGLELAGKDCLYWNYQGACRSCGHVRNIVMEIVPLSRWKILLKK